jgi:diguanylate cyclase (GGDEF)-like protein
MVFEQKLARWGIATAIVLLVAVGWGAHRSARLQASTAAWVAHTHEVIDALEQVVGGLAEAESSLRGYAVARDLRFFVEFEPSIRDATQGLSDAARLTTDNPAQRRIIERVSPLLARRVALLRFRADRLKAGAPAEIPPEAQRLTEQIRGLTTEAIRSERRLLSERRVLVEERTFYAQVWMLGGIVFSVALVLGAFVLLDREMRRRRETEHARERELSNLLEFGERLQACRDATEAYAVIREFGPRFFDGYPGCVSRIAAPRADASRVTAWGDEGLLGDGAFRREDCGALELIEGSEWRGPATGCRHFGAAPPGTTLCLPLPANATPTGALHLASNLPIDEALVQRACIVGEQIALALSNLELRRTLTEQSISDPLTGLHNRRYLEETLPRELSRAQREERSLALVLIDVDHFKRINDTFGHDVGDEVLKAIAELLRAQTRAGDVTSRMGGEEMLVVLPGANLEQATSKAEALRVRIAELELRARQQPIGAVTASFGVAVFPRHGHGMDELLKKADQALYAAKHAGRNQVLAAE